MKIKTTAIAVAAAMALTPAAALAQDTMTTDTAYVETEERDDNDFPWGLLGLLGLAGLMGRNKKTHERDIHVDARDGR